MKLDKAYEIIERAACVMLPDENGALIYASLSNLTDQPDNEFMYLQWEIEGQEYSVKFTQENNEEVRQENNRLIFKTNEGEDFALIPLIPSL